MFQWIHCHVFNSHHWTCAVQEGKPVPPELKPKPEDSTEEMLRKFYTYGRMYCKACGKMSRLNQA